MTLAKNNIKVPSGFVLSNSIYKEYWNHDQIKYNIHDYLAYNREIQKQILLGTFPSSIEKVLEKCFYDLSSGCPDCKYIVRSSSLCEDTTNYSMAGFFESSAALPCNVHPSATIAGYLLGMA